MKPILKVFVDANVFFSASYKQENRFLALWDMDNVLPVTAFYVVQEVKRNLQLPDHLIRFDSILRRTVILPNAPDWTLPTGVQLPDKDIPVLAAAIHHGCKYLITSDRKHFGPYYTRNILGCTILPPIDFIERFSTLEERFV